MGFTEPTFQPWLCVSQIVWPGTAREEIVHLPTFIGRHWSSEEVSPIELLSFQTWAV